MNSHLQRSFLLLTLLAAVVLRSHAAGTEVPIVVTQIPLPPSGAVSRATTASQPGDEFLGARLVMVAPDKSVRVLPTGMDSACDPNVSFDGSSLLFAGKKTRSERWRIYEISLGGGTPRAVSPEYQDARQPIYATTLFTLDSPEPWLTILFSARERFLNETGQSSASSLYNVTLDGRELRRLTFNPNENRDPFQMWDSRVIYSAERQANQPGGVARTGIYAIHVEGADMEFFGGALGKRIQRFPCATANGLIVFVESEQPSPDGSGQLACVEQRRPHVTYRSLTRDSAVAYASPSPLRENRVLVSRRATNGVGTAGIFVFDADTGRSDVVFDSPEFHDVQAVPVKPQPRPDGHSTVVTTTNTTGLFYGLNCYDAETRMAPHLQTGMVKRVRFIEGVVQPSGASRSASGHGPVMARRLVGEAPVEADGSFNVEVPADTPLLLQTLDERGLALGTCGWIWVKPKEKRGCIGCHEDPERIPENEYVLALRRPSNQLVLPPEQRRSVSFRQDVAPILAKHCATADCHGGKDTPLQLKFAGAKPGVDDLRQVYQALIAPHDPQRSASTLWPVAGRYVDAGRARTSWLTWQVTGTNTSRPWDHPAKEVDSNSRKVKPMPPPGKGQPLSPEEQRTIIQWIDLGAQFDAPDTAGDQNNEPTRDQ